MAKVPDDIREIKDRLTNVEVDVNVIKAAVTDQGHELKDHEVRITSLGTDGLNFSDWAVRKQAGVELRRRGRRRTVVGRTRSSWATEFDGCPRDVET